LAFTQPRRTPRLRVACCCGRTAPMMMSMSS
jgi:hypothetical protein